MRMEKIEFLAISAPIWALVLCGISGFLLFVRFSFGKLTVGANFLLLIMVVASVMSCDASGSLGFAAVSYLLPGVAVFLLCWGVDFAFLYFCCRFGRRAAQCQQEVCSQNDGDKIYPGSEYF